MGDTCPSSDPYLDDLHDQDSGMLSPCSDYEFPSRGSHSMVKEEPQAFDSDEDSWVNLATTGMGRAMIVSRCGAKTIKREDRIAAHDQARKQKRNGAVGKRKTKAPKTLLIQGRNVNLYGEPAHAKKKHTCQHISPDGRGQCTSAFERVEHLRRHLLTHDGERKFDCPKCRKPFGRRDNWRDHLKTHLSKTSAGRNDRMEFESMFSILREVEEYDEAEKTIVMLKKWRESGQHLKSANNVGPSRLS
jgi:uncharacterized C2H2 Zn-finger protein